MVKKLIFKLKSKISLNFTNNQKLFYLKKLKYFVFEKRSITAVYYIFIKISKYFANKMSRKYGERCCVCLYNNCTLKVHTASIVFMKFLLDFRSIALKMFFFELLYENFPN